jgi:hypothetical protein
MWGEISKLQSTQIQTTQSEKGNHQQKKIKRKEKDPCIVMLLPQTRPTCAEGARPAALPSPCRLTRG